MRFNGERLYMLPCWHPLRVARHKLVEPVGGAVVGEPAITHLYTFRLDQHPILLAARPSIRLISEVSEPSSPSDRSTRMNARTASSNSASVTPGFNSNSW